MDKKLAEQIIAHIDNAMKHERNRQPVLRVDSSRTSSRFECLLCGVGIRKETFAKITDGMHPNCSKVNADPSLALTMNVNSHAARALRDRLYVQVTRNSEDIAREEAAKLAHKELLKRFAASEESQNVASA